MSRPLVSFVTVNYKMKHYMRHLLQGIEDARLGFTYECFLVDNGSADGVMEMVGSRFPWVKTIVSPANIGLGPAVNLALSETQGRYVLWLNPDLVIFPGELEKWVEWMEAHPDVGVSGPRIVNPDGTDQDSCYRFPGLFIPLYRRTFLGKLPWAKRTVDAYLMNEMDRTKECDVDWVLGAAMLFRSELLDRIGRFDERFFLYFEDADLCHRTWAAGMRVTYTPVAKVVHYHQRQSRTRYFWQALTNPVTRIHIASGVKYFLKHFRQPNPRHARPT